MFRFSLGDVVEKGNKCSRANVAAQIVAQLCSLASGVKWITRFLNIVYPVSVARDDGVVLPETFCHVAAHTEMIR